MRLRLPELLAERKLGPSALHKEALRRGLGDELSAGKCYRLARDEWSQVSRETLEALCLILQVTPGELFEMDAEPELEAAG